MTQTAQLLLILILAVVLSPFLFACGAQPPTAGLLGQSLRPCPDSPNCVSSETESGRARIEPLVYRNSMARAWRNLKQVLEETGGKILTEESGYLRAVYTTPILRFKDDIEFRPAWEGKMIHLRSASRLGYWDLGVNRRRVERIRKSFSALEEHGAGE